MRTVLSLTLCLSALAGTSAWAQDFHLPLDAIGNARVSQAPYVQPATRPGLLLGSDFHIQAAVSAPGEWVDVVEFWSGSDPVARKLLGRYHAGDITVCGDKAHMRPLLDWFERIKVVRSNLAYKQELILVLLAPDSTGNTRELCRFRLKGAFPHQVNWQENGPNVCVQLAVEFIEPIPPPGGAAPESDG